MSKLIVYMYTKGMGSGHLTRINAVYKGFVRAKISCDFYASASRSKYKDFLESGIKLCKKKEFPKNIDIFICDWRSDEFTDALPKSMAKLWIGLRRLGTIKSDFPRHYHIIALEPEVKGSVCIWPVISVWRDELLTRKQLNKLLKMKSGRKVGLLCENGAYPKHLDRVFNQKLPKDTKLFKCSNSPYSEGRRNFSYYPVAKLFKAVDYLVIGGGYNSLHEARCYADLGKTTVINVGGDDQALRIKKIAKWEKKNNSSADELARYIFNLYKKTIKK